MKIADRWTAELPTPEPGERWRTLSQDERIAFCRRALDGATSNHVLQVLDATPTGEVVLNFSFPCDADWRGRLLLDAETRLKQEIDPALVVYLPPIQDRNAARRFRGVRVK